MTPTRYGKLIRQVVAAAQGHSDALQAQADAYRRGEAAAPKYVQGVSDALTTYMRATGQLPSHGSSAETIDNLFAFARWAVRTFPPQSPEGAGALARIILGLPPSGSRDSEAGPASLHPRIAARWEAEMKKKARRAPRRGGVRVAGDAAGQLDVKRLGIPGVRLEVKCPKCGVEWTEELDGSTGILSHPTVNAPSEIDLYCAACDHEWSVPVLLRMSLELV